MWSDDTNLELSGHRDGSSFGLSLSPKTHRGSPMLTCSKGSITRMNTLEPLYEQYLDSDHSNFQAIAQGYRGTLKILQLRHQES